MKLEIQKKHIYIGIPALVLAWYCWGVLQNSSLITSVTISLNDYSIEHRDNTFGELGKADEAPDYHLRYLSRKGWQDLGSFRNTWIGNGLEFKPERKIRRNDILEFQLIDVDTGEDEILEHFRFKKKLHKGGNYTLTASTEVDLKSGITWLF
jgi:hypothetical protein